MVSDMTLEPGARQWKVVNCDYNYDILCNVIISMYGVVMLFNQNSVHIFCDCTATRPGGGGGGGGAPFNQVSLKLLLKTCCAWAINYGRQQLLDSL